MQYKASERLDTKSLIDYTPSLSEEQRGFSLFSIRWWEWDQNQIPCQCFNISWKAEGRAV